MNIRRYYIPGNAVFITQVVQDREPIFRNPEYVSLLREILHRVKEMHPFSMLGYVFLPDHFHFIIQPTGRIILATSCTLSNQISPGNIKRCLGFPLHNP
jgi:putative transposase